jgi:hypothetical protein
VANGENKSQPVASEETGLLDSIGLPLVVPHDAVCNPVHHEQVMFHYINPDTEKNRYLGLFEGPKQQRRIQS